MLTTSVRVCYVITIAVALSIVFYRVRVWVTVRSVLDRFASCWSRRPNAGPQPSTSPFLIRPMLFLIAEAGSCRPPDGPRYPCVLLHFDNQGDRPDDLVTIALTIEDAGRLHEHINKIFDSYDFGTARVD